MRIKKKTILLIALLGSGVGLSAMVAATLHAYNRGLAGAAQSKDSVPTDCNVSARMDAGELVELTAALQNYQPQPGQEDSTVPRPELLDIKSLSADDVRAYEEGAGDGMAEAAERNHYPGPRHVLDLAQELQLTEEQARRICGIESLTHVAAISAGNQLVADERKLNALFAENKIDQSQMASLVTEIASLQGRLRLIHLDAHFETRKILSSAQIKKYDELRGYER